MTDNPIPASTADLPLARTTRLGDLRIHEIESGLQRLDGGAMFGVVPKALWERRIPADEKNRIPLAVRSVLVETPDELVLIETGIGNKENEKFVGIYGIDNGPPPGRPGADRLQAAIHALGFTPEDITCVIDSHLHFDHAGGNTSVSPDGEIQLSFPRATYVVQQGEWDYAHDTNERTRASYLAANYDPVQAAGRFRFIDGDVEVVPGISVVRTPGHTPHHQSILIRSNGETACYLSDVAPTAAHLPLPWIMGYDVEPLRTLESKRGILARAAEERWLLIFTHDAATPWGYARSEGKGLALEPVEVLASV